jgi:hypothetical protein
MWAKAKPWVRFVIRYLGMSGGVVALTHFVSFGSRPEIPPGAALVALCCLGVVLVEEMGFLHTRRATV